MYSTLRVGNSYSTTGEKLWYKDVGQSTRTRKILPEKYRRLFANKQIVCVEYQDITDSDEREIFQVSMAQLSSHGYHADI